MSILSRKEWGLVKSGCEYIMSNAPETETWKRYVFPDNDELSDDDCHALSIMQDADEFPWPDDKCLVFSLRGDVPMAYMIDDERTRGQRINHLDRTKALSSIHACAFRNGKWHPVVIYLAKCHLGDMANSERTLRQELAARFGKHVNMVLPQGDYVWGAHAVGRKNAGDDLELDPMFGMEIMLQLMNTAVPCGYEVHASIANGFGKPSLRKRTKGAEFTVVVNYDRLYHECETSGFEVPPVEPHKRRAHFRFHWKDAGVDRKALSSDPKVRQRIAKLLRVATSWVRACWVGPRHLGNGDISYTVVT